MTTATTERACDVCGKPVTTTGSGNFMVAQRHQQCSPKSVVGSRKTRRTLSGFFSRVNSAGRTWRQRRQLRKFNKDWAKRTPHEQLAAFINILDRHPDLRRAMKEALRLK